MRKIGLSGVFLGVAALLGACGDPVAPADPQTSGGRVLGAGEQVVIEQTLDVNVVFVGFGEGAGAQEVDLETFTDGLPGSYRPINRVPAFYVGSEPEAANTTFDFNYSVKFADASFEDALFEHLSGLAEEKPPTLFQAAYNCQYLPDEENPPCDRPADNVGAVVTDNVWIDAPAAERWLVENAHRLGVDPGEHTVFFLNWYGREDFRFHVYTKTDEPDPDTGVNFGEERDSRKLVAWGGSPEEKLGRLGRVWFVDLSAGPEAWSGTWNITDADLDGDGVFDYRLAPIWDYGGGSGGYRPLETLSVDLAKVTRYVAVNLLFTPSPLYRPDLTPPRLPGEVEVDVTLFGGNPGVDGRALFDFELIAANLGQLQPYVDFGVDIEEERYDAEAEAAVACTMTFTPCRPSLIISNWGGDLFLDNLPRLAGALDGDAEYELPVFAYNVPDDPPPLFLGVADDDWNTGTQSMIYAFVSPELLSAGYGFTTTTIHEVGHHLGLSHPHDGYEPEYKIDYSAGGPFYFAWLGNEAHSMMSYIDLAWSFGQFNRDSMNRYGTAAHLNRANDVLELARVAGAQDAVSGALGSAEGAARSSLEAYAELDYARALTLAREAYTLVLEAALAAGVEVEPFRWQERVRVYGEAAPRRDAGGVQIEHYTPINDGPGALEKRLGR